MSLAIFSLLCGVVAIALLLLDLGGFRLAPVGFGFAIAAVLAGAAARRATGAATPSGLRWVAGTGIAIGSFFLVFVTLVLLTANAGSSRGGESAVLGDIRTLISAEAAYKAASGGHYGPPECLAAPTTCLPGYPANQPTFLDSQLASLMPKTGYSRTFYPGAPAPPPTDGKAGPKGGLLSYAYVAVPVRPGRTGIRGFCGDSTERLCFTVDGTAPPVKDGLCDPCNDLR
jgi:hypothetical protein